MAELNPVWTNGGCVTAQDLRLVPDDLVCTEGVAKVSDGALLVSTGLSGLSVNVAAGGAFIEGTQVDEQGMYHVFNDDDQAVTLDSSDPTLPRIDIIVAQVLDSQYSGGSDAFVLDSVSGTPTSGANLTNLNGIGSLPDNAIALAYVLVPAAATLPGSLTFSDQRQSYRFCADNAALGTALIAVEVYKADDTFVKADYPNGKKLKVQCIGGGGAGGGCAATTGTESTYGTGGGSGGNAIKWLDFDDLGASETVDIGAGGAGASNAVGGNGSPTQFGTVALCKANGGSGGVKSADAGPGLDVDGGGAGAIVTGSVGDVTSRGTQGGFGMRISTANSYGGAGGASAISGGGTASNASGDGLSAAANSGAGGGGAVAQNTESAHKGGDGGSGICIVEVYG